jgi:hypothetical protein
MWSSQLNGSKNNINKQLKIWLDLKKIKDDIFFNIEIIIYWIDLNFIS